MSDAATSGDDGKTIGLIRCVVIRVDEDDETDEGTAQNPDEQRGRRGERGMKR